MPGDKQAKKNFDISFFLKNLYFIFFQNSIFTGQRRALQLVINNTVFRIKAKIILDYTQTM